MLLPGVAREIHLLSVGVPLSSVLVLGNDDRAPDGDGGGVSQEEHPLLYHFGKVDQRPDV